MEWEQLSQGVGRGQLVGRRVASPSEQRVCGHLMGMTAGSRAPRREGKSLQMARLVGKRVLGGKCPVAKNYSQLKVILSLISTCGTHPHELQAKEGRDISSTDGKSIIYTLS